MSGKIKTKKELKDIISSLKKQGKRIVFTNGCFDILHYGHIKYLQDAKGLADVLVLGLNSDFSVKKIKGPARPINKQLDRARVLSALSCVDYLTIFSEDTPLGLIRLIQPDVLVKGGDWQIEKIVGADFVKARGGKVLAIPYIKGYSTTKLINKIRSPRLFSY
ncbi:MAG: D-glycero-beta-D-manno-heptose 1-phosphate adenylyltransferase [Candidatus Omnitrophota bacterium]